MDHRFHPALEGALPPERYAGDNGLWFSHPGERPSFGVTGEPDGLHSVWTLGPRDRDYVWRGSVRGLVNVEKRLLFAKLPVVRRRLRPTGAGLVPFFAVDHRFTLPVPQGGPEVPGFESGTIEYGEHGTVVGAFRDAAVFAVGGCALPSMLRVADVPVDELYRELASPEGGEIFMINPRTANRA